MKIIDLTHLIHPRMPVFPGTERPLFEPGSTYQEHGFQEAKITMFSHTGTHIDAPVHMLAEGPCLDDLEVSHFFGPAVLVDVPGGKKRFPRGIGLDVLLPYADRLQKAAFLILRTGWDQYWGRPGYYQDFPSLSAEAADWLCGFKLKGVGIDAISIDDIDSASYPIHKILMAANMIIIENLTNLAAVSRRDFLLSVLPLKMEQADGSPVRAVALESD